MLLGAGKLEEIIPQDTNDTEKLLINPSRGRVA
jgi:hypothetical protein